MRQLKLMSVERRKGDLLWVHFKVKRACPLQGDRVRAWRVTS